MYLPLETNAEPPVLVHHLLARHQESTAIALQAGNNSLTYIDMYRRARQLSQVLLDMGVAAGDRVAFYLPKGMDECWVIFGISMAGAVFVPINPLLKAPQVGHIVGDSTARVIITDDQRWTNIQTEVQQACDTTAPLFVDSFSLDSLVEPVQDDGCATDATSSDSREAIGADLAAILYTSGSTGRPKGVMLSHDNLLAGTRIVRRYLGITPNDRLLSILPLSFDYGLNQLLTSVEQRATMVPLNFRFGDQIVTAIEQHNITGLAGVPSVWAILTRATPSLQNKPLPTLRYITNTGGPVPTDTVQQLRTLLPDTSIYLMYGLTEAFRSTYLDPTQLDKRPTSIGKAIPECEVLVLNERGKPCAPGEAGILVHRGPTVSLGYWQRPEDTARVLRPNPLKSPDEGVDTVCFSGDLVRTDDEGFLYFVGRNDAMIKSGGYRISPTEVEESLMAGGAFRQVAVIGLPDPVLGNRVHAVAVAAGHDDTRESVRDCLKRCAGVLPGYMVPRDIELVDALPLSPNGKTDYKSLRAERS